jgi:hypothetical protein
MTALHTRAAVAAALTALCAPAATQAATPSFKLGVPSAGNASIAQVVVAARKTPKLTLKNAGALPDGTVAVGGVKRLGKGRFLASLVLARRGEGGSGGKATARLKRGRRIVRRSVGVDVSGNNSSPRFCGTQPSSFSFIARRPLAGSLVSGYDARATAKLAYDAACGGSGAAEEFFGTLDGSGGGGDDDSGAIPPGCNPEEGGEACGEEPDGPTISRTLTGSGTVTQDPGNPNLFTYSVSFNEPVQGFRASVPGTSLHCPTETYAAWYDECQALGNSNNPTAGSITLACVPAQLVIEFECYGPRSAGDGTREGRRGTVTEIPAGTTITGRFSIDAGTVRPGRVQITGIQGNNVEGNPFALSGP